MPIDRLREYYESDADRFWNPLDGMAGRDLDVYPLLKGLNGRLLEFGCGSGSLLLGLAREPRFTECIGVDLSQKALNAIAQAHRSMGSVCNAAVRLISPQSDLIPDIQDQSVDVLISVATIEHVVNPYVVLDELHRVAKPDSTLICSVPNYAYVKHRIQLLFGIQPRTGTDEPVEKWREEGWDGMHLHTFTKSSFTTLLKECRWLPMRWMGCGKRFNWTGLGYFRRRFPGFFSGELIAVCRKLN